VVNNILMTTFVSTHCVNDVGAWSSE